MPKLVFVSEHNMYATLTLSAFPVAPLFPASPPN